MKNHLFRDYAPLMIPGAFRRVMNILPNPDRIISGHGKSFAALRDLKSDAHVWSCLQSRKCGLLFSEYSVSGGAAKRRELALEVLSMLDLPGIYSMMLEAVLYGYQPLEIIWKVSDGLIMPDRVEPRLQEHFAFDSRGAVRFAAIAGKGEAAVPQYKFIMACHEQSASNPYGEPLLSKCYWPVQFKNGGWRYWVSFMEKYGMPVLTGKYPRGSATAEAEQISKALGDAIGDSVIVMPDDIELEMHEPHRYGSVRLYSELIKQCNSEISKALLSQTLTTEIYGASHAAAETHFKIRRELLAADARIINRAMGRLLEYFETLNFGKPSGLLFRLDTE